MVQLFNFVEHNSGNETEVLALLFAVIRRMPTTSRSYNNSSTPAVFSIKMQMSTYQKNSADVKLLMVKWNFSKKHTSRRPKLTVNMQLSDLD